MESKEQRLPVGTRSRVLLLSILLRHRCIISILFIVYFLPFSNALLPLADLLCFSLLRLLQLFHFLHPAK